MLHAWYTHLSDKSKSTPTIALRTKKLPLKIMNIYYLHHEQKNGTPLVKTIKNAINNVNSRKRNASPTSSEKL